MGKVKKILKLFYVICFITSLWIIKEIHEGRIEIKFKTDKKYFASHAFTETAAKSRHSNENVAKSRDKLLGRIQRSNDRTALKDDIRNLTLRDDLVMYNKIEKCGSSSLLSVADMASKYNGFKVYQHILESKNLNERPPANILKKELDAIAKLPRPAVYSRHVFFINFTENGYKKPIYINMVRDPVERFVSQFYFDQVGSFGSNKSRSGELLNINDCILNNKQRCNSNYWTSLITRFFCGMSDSCYNPDDAIKMAKVNIQKEYTFIGITEEFDNSLRLLEKVLPKYFTGALTAWQRIQADRLHRFATVEKEDMSSAARKILTERLANDYEIYRMVKTQFDKLKQIYGIV